MPKKVTLRQKLLAKIHIAAKQARLCKKCQRLCFSRSCPACSCETREMSDFDYRKFLVRITGQTSCRYLSETQLLRVAEVFKLAGFTPKKRGTLKQVMNDSRLAMVKKIKRDAPSYLGGNWNKRLKGYCKKCFGKDDISFCDFGELREIWSFMRKQQKIRRNCNASF